nr:hypothetical protein Iba_chr04aCG25200 [Ipomoea batatas]
MAPPSSTFQVLSGTICCRREAHARREYEGRGATERATRPSARHDVAGCLAQSFQAHFPMIGMLAVWGFQWRSGRAKLERQGTGPISRAAMAKAQEHFSPLDAIEPSGKVPRQGESLLWSQEVWTEPRLCGCSPAFPLKRNLLPSLESLATGRPPIANCSETTALTEAVTVLPTMYAWCKEHPIPVYHWGQQIKYSTTVSL